MTDTSKDGIVKILMNRDGMSREDAVDLYNLTTNELQDAIANSASLCDLEDIIRDNFGLEPDFLEGFLL